MEEKVQVERFFHEHPLILSENVDNEDSVVCYGCGSGFENRESVYVCVQEKYCGEKTMLHQRCGELARQILHPSHAEHPLHLVDFHQLDGHACNLCRCGLGTEFGYRCNSCDFDLDIRCEKLGKDELLGEARQLQHPAHNHPLMLIKKPPFVFTCDACNSEARDMAYACTTCNLLIHKACASLPVPLPTNRHHHHLSLSFCFPFHHRNFKYNCDVCDQAFYMASWVYYCGDCKYFAHFKCVASPTEKDSGLIQEKNDDDAALVQFPLPACDMFKELIMPFVIRELGLNQIPNAKDMPASINMPQTTASYSLLYNYHKHVLNLVSEKLNEEAKGENEDEDRIKICDVCITPISSPPYYECAASTCKYFVHSICYLLSNTLSSLEPLIYGNCQGTGTPHTFTRYTSLEQTDAGHPGLLICDICWYPTNGMVYQCQKCAKKIDIKCASQPTAITHAFHLHHKLIKTILSYEEQFRFKCICCGYYCSETVYRCTIDGCSFKLDEICVMLPQSVTIRDLDKHPLMLTCDASLNHPTDFYCGICEIQMHPKSWMYHCCECDNSFHIDCLKTTSGDCRNIKYGQQFEIDGLHPHPLTFNLVTNFKMRCCGSSGYNQEGFECASCYFAVCRRCGIRELDNMSFS